MEVADLLAGLDAEVAKSEETIGWLTTELAREQQNLTDLRREVATVRSAVQRLSGGPAVRSEPCHASWLSLSKVDAVERALSEAGPLHLREIVDLLAAKGRGRTTTAAVSACLSHLSQVRHTVVNVGKGRWNYVPPAPNLRLVGAVEKLPSQEVATPDSAIPVASTGSPIA